MNTEEQLEIAVRALRFYAGTWGENLGSPIKAVNKFAQDKLNESRATALDALEEMGIPVQPGTPDGEK